MSQWFYLVCECGAKFYGHAEKSGCPRCQALIDGEPSEQPPWLLSLNILKSIENSSKSAPPHDSSRPTHE